MSGSEGLIIYSALYYNLVITVIQIKDYNDSLEENTEFGHEDQGSKCSRNRKSSRRPKKCVARNSLQQARLEGRKAKDLYAQGYQMNVAGGDTEKNEMGQNGRLSTHAIPRPHHHPMKTLCQKEKNP